MMPHIILAMLMSQMYPGDTTAMISVQGVAFAEVAPDMAEIWVSVSGEGLSEEEAYKACWKTGEKLIKSLKKAGLKPENIRSGAITRIPQETYDEMGNPVSKPGIYQMDINLKVHDLSRLPKIMEAALKVEGAVVNQVAYNSYALNDAVKKVIPDAVADARAQAEAMAQAEGVAIDPKPRSVSTNIYYPAGQVYSCSQGWCPPPGGFLEVPVYVYVIYRLAK